MRTLLLTAMLLWLTLCTHAQTSVTDRMLGMYELENYRGAVELAQSADSLDIDGYYLLGLSYYAIGENLLAAETLGRVKAAEPTRAGAWFFRGQSLLSLGHLREAVIDIRRAHQLVPNDCDYTAGLADAFRANNQIDSALLYYRSALHMHGCLEDLHLQLGQTYEEIQQPDSALKVYYAGFRKLSSQSASYQETIYRIGVLEYLQGNLHRAEALFLKGIHEFPGEIPFIAKLIQVYHALEQYEKADFLKQRIYGALARGEVNAAIREEGFCIDQFDWKDHRIFVFEHFPPGQSRPFDKYVFYVTDDRGGVCNQIQLEHRPSYRQKGYFFALSVTNQKGHVTLSQYRLPEDVAYPELKETVLQVLRKQ